MGFNQPVAAALGQGNMVYVLNRGIEGISNVAWNKIGYGARVSMTTIGTTPGDEEYIGEFGKYGSGEGEFIWASGIAVDRAEHVYVSDEWLNRINVYDKGGKFLNKWSTLEKEGGLPHGTASITLDADENIYLTDSRSHQVRKFSRDGKFLGGWGRHGEGNGEFNAPWGITVDQQGFVYVADHKNHRVQKFTPEGAFVAQFGRYGTGKGELNRPTDVAVDPDGDVYVCDWANHRIQVFGPEGQFVTSLVGDAQELSKWAKMTLEASPDSMKRRREVRSLEREWRFAFPTAVVFDPRYGRLIVSDTQRNRLQIYNKLKNYQMAARTI
jgi:DNA-binding beta-propeller fold protein YncE